MMQKTRRLSKLLKLDMWEEQRETTDTESFQTISTSYSNAKKNAKGIPALFLFI